MFDFFCKNEPCAKCTYMLKRYNRNLVTLRAPQVHFQLQLLSSTDRPANVEWIRPSLYYMCRAGRTRGQGGNLTPSPFWPNQMKTLKSNSPSQICRPSTMSYVTSQSKITCLYPLFPASPFPFGEQGLVIQLQSLILHTSSVVKTVILKV